MRAYRHRQIRVPQQFFDDFGIEAAIDQQTRVAPSQVAALANSHPIEELRTLLVQRNRTPDFE